MPRRVELPPELTGRAFTPAEAREVGIGRGRLAGEDLRAPHRGVRTADELSPAEEYAPLLRPGDRFSHTTAARLWGAPLPWGRDLDLHVTATSPAGRPRGKDVSGHEGVAVTAIRRHGVPVSDPVLTLVECARVVSLSDLVAIADHLVLDPRVLDPRDIRPHITLLELRTQLALSRAKGVTAARRAAHLAREGVESPMETRLRLLLRRHGVPEPTCGFELIDPRGPSVGWFDLAWPDFRVIAEYDGDQHRTSRWQYERDISRFDRADELGWKVVRVRAAGLRGGRFETVSRVHAALAARGWRRADRSASNLRR